MPLGGLISGGIGAVGSLVGGIFGSSAASKAAKIQQQNAQQVANMAQTAAGGAQSNLNAAVPVANSTLQQSGNLASNLYGNETNNLNPYLAAGTQGANGMAAALAPGGSLTQQFTAPTAAQAAATPGFQFTMNQGLNALNRSAAATGGVDSGNTLAALTQYGQGLASTNYQQTYNNAANAFQMNHQNTLQGLEALTGVGQNATGQLNQATQQFTGLNTGIAGQQSANTMGAAVQSGNWGLQGSQIAGQALTGGANAAAAGTMGAANAWSGALGGATNSIAGGLAGYQANQMLNPSSNFMPYSSGTPFSTTGLAGYMPAPTMNPAANYQMPNFAQGYAPPAPNPATTAGGL